METASPGPRRIRINPFSSSSSTFSSRAEGLAEAGTGTFSSSGGRLETPTAVESLKRSCKPRRGVSAHQPAWREPYPPARVEGGTKPRSPSWPVLGRPYHP